MLAAFLLGLKAGRTIISTGHILGVVFTGLFGAYHIVQWIILIIVLIVEEFNHTHKNLTCATTVSTTTNNYLVAKRQAALRNYKVRKVRA